ncbi:DUF222 domain-containing protein [uncultured Jatrophihabitans sp.]|uniref:HNH endonuclease n=1 Tax=uncultured Jatrophihabitans sp. TaxID=1610747 RepID=UPI0035CAFE4A
MATGSSTDTDAVCALVAALGSLSPAVDDADRIDRVRLFEELKAAAAAAQVVEARDFEVSQRAQQAIVGVPVKQQGRGIAAQIGLARRISPWAAQRYLGWATILPTELPHTFAALQAGRITEWRATLIARETIWLSRQDRETVDAELAPQLEAWSDRRVEAETRKAGYRLDPQGFLARVRGADKDRRVNMRPVPDAMARLTALLPVAQGVATYQALCQAADTTTTAGGDERGRGQIMADTLVERITGQTTATAVPVEIELIMTDTTLFTPDTTNTDDLDADADADLDLDVEDVEGGADDEPGLLVGFGPIPAGLARELALGCEGDTVRRRIRRLFLHPSTRQLAAMESTSRLFTDNERRFIRLRDHGTCRTPWCGAPIRHTDHIRAHGQGGRTDVGNGQGLCEACNYAKQAPGWRAGATTNGTIITETPTGQHYRSQQPDPPGRTSVVFATQVRVVDLVYHSTHPRRAA